ncbi:MAG: hypothetical protein ACQEXX_01865 [Bacillota bacterium]
MQKEVTKKIPLLFQSMNTYESESSDLRFQKVKIWLCHTGENLNGSYFSKESIEDAIPSLSNTPILAYIENNKSTGEKDFSDHREVLTKKDGEYMAKYMGKAIGVIPSENNAKFEDRLCDDGVTRTFLTVEGLLWTKFDDSTDIMSRDIVKNQSMELDDDYEGQWEDDNYFHFTKFKFYGACGLGEGIEPAMKNSTIELQFSASEFINEVNIMTEKFKQHFSVINNVAIPVKEKTEVKTKAEIAISFNLTVGQLGEELRRKLSEIKYTTTNWFDEEIELTKYYLKDFNEQYVFAVDRQGDYIDVKIPYGKKGDDVTFDLEGIARIKYVPTDWENGEDEDIVELNYSSVIESEYKDFAVRAVSDLKDEISQKNSDYIELNDKFATVQAELTSKADTILELNKEIETLKNFQRSVAAQERKEQIEALFSKLSKSFSKDELHEWREKETTYESVESFEKDIKAFAYDRMVETNKDIKTDFSQMSTLQDTDDETSVEKKSTDVWSRLSK